MGRGRWRRARAAAALGRLLFWKVRSRSANSGEGGGWGETLDTGVPRAVVLSCVLQEGLALPGGAG